MFEKFSPQSKVWVYQSSRVLTDDEVYELHILLTNFIKQWTAHNTQLNGAAEVLENRFILLLVDETHAGASGCSIDKSVHFVKSLEQKFDIDLFDRMLIYYKVNDILQAAHLNELQDLFSKQVINSETIIYNPLVQTKDDFDKNFIVHLHNSWLKKFV